MLDTQIPGKTGLFFRRQTPESLQSALLSGAKIDWDYAQIREHAVSHFSEAAFFRQLDLIFRQQGLDFAPA